MKNKKCNHNSIAKGTGEKNWRCVSCGKIVSPPSRERKMKNKIKIYTINGKIEKLDKNIIWFGIWKNPDGYWQISSIFYHDKKSLQDNLEDYLFKLYGGNFSKCKILAIKVTFKEDEK